ncbi:MAG: ABC transporter permease [Alphaproteobacteria bacterium]
MPPAIPSADLAYSAPRAIGAVNWTGLWTLYAKEVRRFAKVWAQTLFAPLVTTLMFLGIFVLAVGGAVNQVGGVGFGEFLAPGLTMMAMIQNAFTNTSSSIVISKVQGNIVDVLMPPLSPAELTLAYVGAGITRGVMVGALNMLALSPFVSVQIHDFGLIAFHAVAASSLLAMLGLMGGIWADKFDHLAAVGNFVITPLSFLSGTFYSIERLPGIWLDIAHVNPFFFMIDGFRAGFIGHADGSLWLGIVVMLGLNAVFAAICLWMFRSGYKLKS